MSARETLRIDLVGLDDTPGYRVFLTIWVDDVWEAEAFFDAPNFADAVRLIHAKLLATRARVAEVDTKIENHLRTNHFQLSLDD